MNEYKLSVVKLVPNPHFAEQVAQETRERNQRSSYGQFNELPSAVPVLVDERVLEVTLTEDEFLAVKRAALEAFK